MTVIVRLMVRDWGPFDMKTVEFTPGKNVIYGNNFSGKTSLINAMFYALTGEVLAPKAKPADFAKARSKDSIVELDIVLGSKSYRIRRRPTRRQSHLLLLEDGSEVSEVGSGSTVDMKVAELLGVEIPELTQAIFMKEGDIAEYLASSTPGKRKDFIKSLIKMDRLEEIADAAKEWQKEVNAQSRELDRTLAQARTGITMLKSKPLTGDRAQLEQEIAALEARREDQVEQKAALKETADSVMKLENSGRRLDALTTEKNSLQGKLGTQQSPYNSVDEIKSEVESITTEPGELKSQQDVENEVSKKRDIIQGRREVVQEAVDSVQGLKSKGADECPTCHQKITPEILDSIIAEKKKELQAIVSELAEASQSAQEASKERKSIQDALVRKEELGRRIIAIEEIGKRLVEYEKDIPRLEGEIEGLKKKVEGAERIHEIDSEITRIDSDLKEAREKRDGVIADEAALKEATAKVDGLEEREGELAKNRALAKLLRTACEATIVELGSIPIKKIEQLATGAVSRLGIFDGWHVDLEKNMLLPVAERENESVQAATMAASEKMLCFLAIRFAMAQSIMESDFMVLDEPTEHLDSEHVEKIKEFLRDVPLPEQIIVTSNEQGLIEGDWANVIKV